MNRTLATLLLTLTSGCTTIQTSPPIEKKSRPDLIQAIPHYNHVNQSTVSKTLMELHESTTLDAIITDKFSSENQVIKKLKDQGIVIIPSYTEKETSTRVENESLAYQVLCSAKLSFINEYQERTQKQILTRRLYAVLHAGCEDIAVDDIVENIVDAERTLSEIQKQKLLRQAAIYKKIEEVCKTYDNVALVIQADDLPAVMSKAMEEYRFAIISPTKKEIEEFETISTSLNSEHMRDKYQKKNDYLDTILRSDDDLNKSYLKFRDSEELPRNKNEI